MTKRIAVLLVAVVVVAWGRQRNVAVSDGFETLNLSEHWERGKFLPGAVQIQSSVVRAGIRAVRIILRPGDQLAQEKESELERAELLESRRLWSVEDSAYEYSFSVFVPQEFPIGPTRIVIAQWKEHCPVETCTPGNPVLAVRYEAGELFIAHQVTAHKEVLYRTQDDIRNRWLDFRFQVRFSRSRSGRIKAWIGNTIVVDYKGVTAYPVSGGYVKPGIFYFKMGLYRDRSLDPMTIYVDEYRKQPLDAFVP